MWGNPAMPDSKPNDARVNLLKEFFEDLLKPGYVNQRIESLKKLHKKQKKDPEAGLLQSKETKIYPTSGAGALSLPLLGRDELHGF